jgi:3-oxoacyl-[acyl-carrier-protein] synthase-1
MNQPIYLNQMGVACALGCDHQSVWAALQAQAPSGVAPNDRIMPGRNLHLGTVTAPLAAADALLPTERSHNNLLMLTILQQIRPAVEQAIALYGRGRIAIILGTSTSGIAESEQAIACYQKNGTLPAGFDVCLQEMGSPALTLRRVLGLHGPATVISTACSSSAKALASAARALQAGICDAVICGGVDALSAFTIAGFDCLQAISAERCNPMSANRCGINIGEGGALFLMTREPGPVRLAGWGESADAHHLSAPAPDGRGAKAAMQAALTRAGVSARQIDYLNMHGTATHHNDAMESLAIAEILGQDCPVSSTKPLTGHTLGGAGAVDAALCWLALHNNPQGYLPPHWWDGVADPALPALHLVNPGESLGRPLEYAMSNSFAFGGSNACLILARP